MNDNNPKIKPIPTFPRDIIFDLGGILVTLDGQSCVDALDHLGLKTTAAYVRAHRCEDHFLDYECGRIDTSEFCRVINDSSPGQVASGQIIGAWQKMITGLAESKVKKLLQLKAAGHRLFLLSNTNPAHWQRCRDLFLSHGVTPAELFESLFLSYELHVVKPDPQIFITVADQAALDPTRTLFIDDLEANCLSAAQVGFKVLHDPSGMLWCDMRSDLKPLSD